ncbi:hypothetical protein BJY04DRAFT_216309 [Aspergillus karnatakaensis]|uniref:uncharacterized protein n=1 Tax=Aspergillus karnatakaensis TaxID=1810916 RepID=UPI003CCD9BDA
MPSLLTLPREIVHRVFFYAEQESRKHLRLSSTLLGETGQSWVFQSTTISRKKSSIERFQNILDRSELANAVTKVYLDTTDPEDGNGSVTTEDGDEYLEAAEEDEDTDAALPPRFWKAVNKLHQLPRLQSVVIRFHPECEDEDDWGDAQQPTAFRQAVLQKAFSILASLPRPIQELGIQDLQNITPDDEEFKANATKVLGGLKSLRLNIANELNEGNGENNIEKNAVHSFFNHELSDFWLKPTLANLEHLSIYSSMYWGFFPACDITGLHFPRLKSLALGNYTFVDDRQLDWVLSHSSTLEELYLDDCPILIDVAVYHEHLDERGTLLDRSKYQSHPGFRSEPGAMYNKLLATYGMRWADYFRAFNERLPHLKHFRVGHNPHWWENDTTPFEVEEEIEIGFYESYMVYCDGYGPSQYMERLIYDHDFEGEGEAQVLRPSEADMAELKELLEKLRQDTEDLMDRYR